MARNDKPSSLRRGHGPKEAFDQGIPWSLINRDGAESVRRLNEAQKRRKAIEVEVAELTQKHPHLKARALVLRREGKFAVDILNQIKIEAVEFENRRQAGLKSKL